MLQKNIIGSCLHKKPENSMKYSLNWINKHLEFFLLKKKFFLYKSFSNGTREDIYKRIGANHMPIRYTQCTASHNTTQALVNRLRAESSVRQSVRDRKFIFYRIKKNFWKINKKTRSVFFKNAAIRLTNNELTAFFLKSKNFEKKKIFSELVNNNNKHIMPFLHLITPRVVKMLLVTPNNIFGECRTVRAVTLSSRVQKLILTPFYENLGSVKYTKSSFAAVQDLNKLKVVKKAKRAYRGTLFGELPGSFVDPRQLISFNYKSVSQRFFDDRRLTKFNAFNFRSHNWKIIT